MKLKKERFLHDVGLAALAVGKYYHIDPMILLAHAAVETEWGQTVQGNNYFNLRKGFSQKGNAEACVFATPLDSFVAYMRFILTNPQYELARYLFHSPGDYFVALQKAGYATDPNYAAKCLATYHSLPDDWLEIILESIKE